MKAENIVESLGHLSGREKLLEESHLRVAFSFWEGSDGNGSDKIDCTPCE